MEGGERGRGVLVCIPTYNEAENLPRIVPAVLEAMPEAHVLVVDDRSPDGTGALADALAARDPRIHVLHRAGKEGLGKAYLAAFAWALARDYAFVFELDADFSHDPKYLPAFTQRLRAGADVVIGSRRVPGGGVQNWGLGRRAISWGGSLYARAVLGVAVKDLTGGFNGFRREALERLGLAEVRSSGYCFQIELKYRALRRGLRVEEAPIVFPDRVLGKSKMSRKILLEALGHVWRLRALDRPPGARAGRAYWAVMALVLAASILPFLVTRFPPLHDYPNHLARTYIVQHLQDIGSFHAAYASEWRAYPNLAIDLVVAGLLRVVGVETAGKLFLIGLPLLLILGADRLARAIHGGPSWTAPLAGFLGWNGFVLWGFVNYVFGLGVFALALAAWLRAQRGPWSWPRIALAAVGALCAYLAHETAFAFLGLAAVVWVLAERGTPFVGRAIRGGLPLLPPVALGLLGGLRDTPGAVRWDHLGDKLKGPFMLVATYHVAIDVLLGALFLVALALLLRRASSVSGAALVTAALFAVIFAAAPTEWLGGWALDRRFLPPAALLALLAFRVRLDGRAARAGFALALAIVVGRGAIVTATWHTLGADLARRAALLDRLPRGASVFGFARVDPRRKATWTREMGLVYLHQYAAILRDAPVSGLFAHANQQPLRFRLPGVSERPGPALPPEAFRWDKVFARYQYVFAAKLDEPYRRFLAQRCHVLAEAGDAAVFERCRL